MRREEFLTDWLGFLARDLPRPPGSPGHRALVERIATELTAAGLTVGRDLVPLRAWDPHEVRLEVDGGPVPVASAMPWSGTTGPAGVTAPLRRVRGPRLAGADGSIAVVEVPYRPLPTGMLVDVDELLPAGAPPLGSSIGNPVLSATLLGPDLARAARRGARAVVAVWRDMPERLAAGQWLPFTAPYAGLPGVWVAGAAGDAVLAASRAGRSARLVLDAGAEQVPTETVWAVVPGARRDETVLHVTHTDGVNPVEENGALALVSLAHDLARSRPERTHVLVAVSGHLRIPDALDGVATHGQATTRWLEQHRELWDGAPGHATAVAATVAEHLGSTAPGPGGAAPVPDLELWYATTPRVRQLVHDASRGRTVPYRAAIVRPRSLVHLGEGESLYQAGVPAAALLGAPDHLLAEPTEHGIGGARPGALVDPALVSDQLDVIHAIARALDREPRGRLGALRRPGWAARARDLAGMVTWIARTRRG